MDHSHADRRSAPRLLARYIDPAWRMRSKGDADVKRDLEGVLGEHLKQGRIDLTTMGDILIVACRDRSSATELRFMQREIVKTLHAIGQTGIQKVRIVLSGARPEAVDRASRTVQRRISAGARRSLEMAAAGIDDARLAQALRRLAKAGRED